MLLNYDEAIKPRTNPAVSNKLKQILHKLNPENNLLLVVHSSLLTFRRFDNPVDNSIRALVEYSDETGATIFFPTFTFTEFKKGHYSPQSSPCDTGLLSETVRKMNGVVRSRHPLDSYAAYGPRKNDTRSFFGVSMHESGSAAEYFDRNNALVMAWGAKLSYLTIIHYYEFLANVPYRFYKTFEGTIDDAGQISRYRFDFKVKNYDALDENPSFEHLHKLLAENITFKKCVENGATFMAADARAIGGFLLPYLKDNPFGFLNNPDYTRKALSK